MSNVTNEKRQIERILISRATPGMELARDIYSRHDQIILNAGTILNAQMISKIMFYSIESITVYKQSDAEQPETLTEKLKNSVEYREFTKRYDETVNSVKNSIDMISASGAELDEDFLLNEVDKMVMETGSKTRIFNMLHCIRDYDEVTYMHSFNVSLICNCFAKWLNMNEEETRLLTLAGLLHDIGKTTVPREILQKPDALTEAEYNAVKLHTIRGYDMLKDKKIDDRIKMVALQHHERADGSGYPFGKSANEIEPFAMIVSIADVYDAMTSDRVYRPRICPFDVVKSFESEGKDKYNPEFLVPLLEQISDVYINHSVRLSDDSVGKIVLMNHSEPSKPVVQVGNGLVDLAKKRDIKIKEML